jgi:hypothetical protein
MQKLEILEIEGYLDLGESFKTIMDQNSAPFPSLTRLGLIVSLDLIHAYLCTPASPLARMLKELWCLLQYVSTAVYHLPMHNKPLHIVLFDLRRGFLARGNCNLTTLLTVH